jgi:PAS domain S-box-containing protein
MESFKSYLSPILVGGGLLSIISIIQKASLGYPFYPVSFIVPFTAGGIAGLLYHLRRRLEQKHYKKTEQYNKRLEAILDTVQSGIIIIDAKSHTINYINTTAQLLFGYLDTEIVGKKCYDYLCDLDPADCPIQKQDISIDNVDKIEIKTTDLNIPIIRKVKKIAFDDHLHFIISVMDISPIVDSEEKIRAANERVRIADRLKTEFLTNVGHEIRTPLNAVIGISEILMSLDLSDEIIEDLKLIKNSGISLLKTMENIMDYSMVKSGNYVLQQNPFDIYQSLFFISESYQVKATQKGLAFHMDIENCKDIQYVGDYSVFNKVIGNVLDNAVKFTSSGSVTMKTNVISDPSMIDIQISDTGIGMPGDKQEYIFDAFYQINGSMTREYEGTGMGLALVEFFSKKMDVSIAIESSIGKGSTFHIYIPV